MIHFTKRLLIASLLLITSALAAGNPVSWSYHDSNNRFIKIWDNQGHVISLIPDNKNETASWSYDALNPKLIAIQDEDGDTIARQLFIPGDSQKIVNIDGKSYLLPKRPGSTFEPLSRLVTIDGKSRLIATQKEGDKESLAPPSADQIKANLTAPSPCFRAGSKTATFNRLWGSKRAQAPQTGLHTNLAFGKNRITVIAEQANIVGEKRKRQEDPSSTQQINPAKRQKKSENSAINNFYWRIHPTQDKHYQILKKDGTVVVTKKVGSHINFGRNLSRGYLPYRFNGKHYSLKRSPYDLEELSDHGFYSNLAPVLFPKELMTSKADGSNKEIFSKVATDHSYLKDAAYWRIAPDQDNRLQFCDKRGNVLHTEDVINHNGKRKLNQGFLYMRDGRKVYTFKRHKSDTQDLEEHGFATGCNKTVKYYQGPDLQEIANGFAASHIPPVLFPKDRITSAPNNLDIDQAEENSMQCEEESYDGDLPLEENAMQCEAESDDGEDLSPEEMLLFLKYQ